MVWLGNDLLKYLTADLKSFVNRAICPKLKSGSKEELLSFKAIWLYFLDSSNSSFFNRATPKFRFEEKSSVSYSIAFLKRVIESFRRFKFIYINPKL